MSTPPTPPPVETRGVSPELKEMLDFISRENERNRDFFNDLFGKSRTFLLLLLAAISGGVAFVGYKTISDAKNAAETAAATAVTDRLKELKPKIDQQIVENVSAEFATPKIDKLVAESADVATQRLADPLIRKQVEQQVAVSVRRQDARIDTTLTREVGRAVNEVRDKVQEQTDSEINKIVTATVAPQLKQLVAANAEATQFAFAKTGDGIAFDNLAVMSRDKTLPEQIRQSASIDLSKIMQQFPSEVPTVTGCRGYDHPPQFYEDQISAENLAETLNALGCLNPWGWPAHDLPPPGQSGNGPTPDEKRNFEMLYPSMERLFQVACNDPRLYVRVVAFRVFQALAQADGRPFPILNPLDNQAIAKWWFGRRGEYIRTK